MSKQTVRIHVDTCTAVDWYPGILAPDDLPGDSAFEVECGKPAEYLEIVRYHNESAWDEINEGHGTPENGVSVHTLCAEHAAAYDAEALGMPDPYVTVESRRVTHL